MFGGIKALLERGKDQVQDLNKSQELGIFHNEPEAK